ncbi:MAG: hypothetical protein KA100_05360 [Rickettsiales bacterium]|nr:hypothetical protein [Rickettsiales bacterium]
MSFVYLLIDGLLIFLCLAGLCGLFFFEEYIRKISCLSISYSSFLILVTLLALKSARLNEVLVIMVSILAIFSVNLLIGIGIARNIAEAGVARGEEKSV